MHYFVVLHYFKLLIFGTIQVPEQRPKGLKPATRGGRRKSPGVPGAVMAIFDDRRDRRIKSPISGMSDIGDLIRRHSPSVPVPLFFTLIAANRH